MKLKTKFQDEDFELGEVVEAKISTTSLVDTHIKVKCKAKKGGEHLFCLASIKEFTDLFEDYEEPKEYWAIDIYSKGAEDFKNSNDDVDKFNKEIGNYFETKEEAEQAVEKLKAWKRLKDKGFKFIGRDKPNYGEEFIIRCYLPTDTLVVDVASDLDLLFGGEE